MLEELYKVKCASRTCTVNIEIRAIKETEKKDVRERLVHQASYPFFFPFSKQQSALLKKIKSPWYVIADLFKTFYSPLVD